jgi:mono/diheme cytochrome c family protein
MIRTGWRGRSEAKEVFSYQFTVHSLGSRENTTQEYGREGGAEDYTWRKWPDGPLTRQVEQGDQGMKLVFVCGLSVVLAHSFLQEPQKPAEEKPAAATEAKPVASAAKLVNPTKATAESIALGKKAYGTDCAMCHGKTGAGDGDLAADMKLKLRDYRDPESLKAMTDGEIYLIIANGKGQMSGEEGRMKPGQMWDVVNYVRSLGKK